MAQAAAYDELMALGYRRVPLTLVGDQAIVGYDADALASALGIDRAAAVPSSRPSE